MDNYNKISFSPLELQKLNDDQLTVLYHSSNWSKLDNTTKLDLCQEFENRLAFNDNVNPRQISIERMDGKCYGYQQGDKITLNADMLNDGKFRIYDLDEKGNIALDQNGNPTIISEHNVPAISWNVYNTVVHEHTHGVSQDKGTQPYTYFSADFDYDLYRIQPEEKLAYATGDYKTLTAMERAEELTGIKDPQRHELAASIKNDSFQKSLEAAQSKYNDPYIEKTVEGFINDNEQGITKVSPSASYNAVKHEYENQLIQSIYNYFPDKSDDYINNAQTNEVTKLNENFQAYDNLENNVEYDGGVELENNTQEYNTIENDGIIEEIPSINYGEYDGGIEFQDNSQSYETASFNDGAVISDNEQTYTEYDGYDDGFVIEQ